jgi:hypothetical protein
MGMRSDLWGTFWTPENVGLFASTPFVIRERLAILREWNSCTHLATGVLYNRSGIAYWGITRPQDETDGSGIRYPGGAIEYRMKNKGRGFITILSNVPLPTPC